MKYCAHGREGGGGVIDNLSMISVFSEVLIVKKMSFITESKKEGRKKRKKLD